MPRAVTSPTTISAVYSVARSSATALSFSATICAIEDHQANNDRLTVPTAAERAGDLTVSTTTIYDPASSLDPSKRAPFADKMIPTSRINSISAKILGIIHCQTLAASIRTIS